MPTTYLDHDPASSSYDIFQGLNNQISSIATKAQKEKDDNKAIQQYIQKMLLESALKDMRLKTDANFSNVDTSKGIGGLLGQVPTMFEKDPMTGFENQAKIADMEKKIYDAGGPAPSRTPRTILGGGQPVSPGYMPSDVSTDISGMSPKEANELRMVAEKAKIADTYRPASQAEETSALYANRMEQAEKVFTDLEGELSHLGLGASIMQAKGPLGVGVPNWAKTSDAQSYDQAKRNFLNSVLRKESGAVISPTEFAEGNQQYFPQPGDKAEVIAQKKANRRVAIEGLKQAGGKAYKGNLFTGKSNSVDLKSKYGLE